MPSHNNYVYQEAFLEWHEAFLEYQEAAIELILLKFNKSTESNIIERLKIFGAVRVINENNIDGKIELYEALMNLSLEQLIEKETTLKNKMQSY